MKLSLINSFYSLLNCKEVVLFIYDKKTGCYTGLFRGKETFYKKNEIISIFLNTVEKPVIKNTIPFDDILSESIKKTLSIKARNYIIAPIRNFEGYILGHLLFVDKEDRNHQIISFSKLDKVIAYISEYLYLIGDKISTSLEQMEYEKYLKIQTFSWTVDLVSSVSQATLIQIMESQLCKLIEVERSNVLFYDSQKNELYKRIKKEDQEELLCNLKLGWPCTKGIAGFSILTSTPIMENSLEKDSRFYPEIDDFNYSSLKNDNHASRILAIPLINKDDIQKKLCSIPKGMLIVINKKNGRDFNQEDIDNVRIYAKLTSKMIEVSNKLEFLHSIGSYLRNIHGISSELDSTKDHNTSFLNDIINLNFKQIDNMFNDFLHSKNVKT